MNVGESWSYSSTVDWRTRNQLTMRTFHIGGAAQKGTEISNIESKVKGKIKYINLKSAKDSSGNIINMSRNATFVLDENNKEKAKHSYRLVVK